MNEETQYNQAESAEKIHNEREILNIMESIVQGEYEIVRSLEDENGPYLFDVKTIDESGDDVVYTYMRAGDFAEGTSAETVIDVIFYSGDMPVGGRSIMKYKNGEWVKEAE